MHLLLMRHAPLCPRTVPDAAQRCYGRTDWPADEAGTARAVSALMNGQYEITHVESSPAVRCMTLARQFDSPVITNPLLQELDFGSWEGRRWDDIPRDDIDAWAQNVWHYRPGGGENAAELRKRVRRALQHWKQHTPANGSALVVTHAGFIRMLLAETGQIEEQSRWNHPVPYATPLPLHIDRDLIP